MIITSIDQLHSFTHVHPGLEKAGRFLERTDLSALADGHHDIDGDELFAIVSACEGKGRSGARLEAHRRYIDVQYCLSGSDVLGFRPFAQCTAVVAAYDEDKDVIFFDDPVLEWNAIEGSTCAVFLPEDAHAPLGGVGPCKKIVVKIRV